MRERLSGPGDGMRSMVRVCWLTIGCLLILSDQVLGQSSLPKNTQSHRAIPSKSAAEAPSVSRMLRDFQNQLRIQNEQPLPPEIPGVDQLSSETKGWLKDLNQRALSELAHDARTAAGDVLDPVSPPRGRASQPRMPTLRDVFPDLNLPDLSNGPVSNQQLRNMIKDLREQIRSRQEANAPPPGIGSQEWLSTIKPYLEKGLADTLSHASDPNSQGETPAYQPETRRYQNLSNYIPSNANSPSSSAKRRWEWSKKPKAMVDSLIKSIDKKGSTWLKQQAEANRDSAWVRNIGAKTKARLRQWNRKWSANSRAVSQTIDAIEPPVMLDMTSPATHGDGPNFSLIAWIVGGVIVSVVCIALLLGWMPGLVRPPFSRIIDTRAITDRESFLNACHRLLLSRFGFRSCFWNHLRLFESLASELEDRRTEIELLTGYYERARYAPDSHALSSSDLLAVKRLFGQIQQPSPLTA